MKTHVLRGLHLILGIIALLILSCTNQTGSTDRPNILLVLIDDCSADELSCYGSKVHHTPVLDQLAIEGARFETCWATPLCSPSRSLLMTGRYGFRTGWYANSMKKGIPLPEENIIFAQLLQEAGYRTAVAGKWQLPGLPPEYGFDQWSLWAYRSMLPEGVDHPGVETLDSTKYNFKKPARFWHPSVLQNGDYLPTTVNDYGPDVHTDFLMDFMSHETDQPFLAYYPMVLTHDPFFPTPQTVQSDEEKFGASDQDRNFKANVEYMDHCIGRILETLKTNGQLENTAVIVTADNGTLRRGKGVAKEIGVREPLIVHWPGKIENQGVRQELIDFSDIFPTVLDMAGVAIPEDYIHDGLSFLPLLENKAYQEREYIYSYLDTRRLLRDKRWLMEGDGSFYDCGDSRDPRGYMNYRDVSHYMDAEAFEARLRFMNYLNDKSGPSEFKEDKLAIQAIIEAEMAAFYDQDLSRIAATWVHKATSSKVMITDEGVTKTVGIEAILESDREALAREMGADITWTAEYKNFMIHVFGKTALAYHDSEHISNDPQGQQFTSFKRMIHLVQEEGKWKMDMMALLKNP